MTAIENVMIGAFHDTSDVGTARVAAQRALEAVGLGDRARAHARGLSTGQRKRLELARALATRPRLLLLDEVTGGVDQATVPGLIRLVRELHETGLALIVIEHNMRVIMEISQRVVALQLGEVIADGRPAEIVRDRRVIDAYLGESWTA
jgi:branched-chain amino acid transport system ATP-binding protein